MPQMTPAKPKAPVEVGYCQFGCGTYIADDQDAYEFGYKSVDGSEHWPWQMGVRSHFLECPRKMVSHGHLLVRRMKVGLAA